MSRGGSLPRGNESQAKFCQDRVAKVEKHYGNLCETLASITRKAARQRDKGDLLAKQLVEYSNVEDISHSTKAGLHRCAENMSAIQDYREAEIKRLEAKVVRPMSDYGGICKSVKNGVKTELTNIKKEQKKIQDLEKVKSKTPGDQHQIQRAETEVRKANVDAEMGSKALEEQMILFEKNRLTDLKNSLADFINIEMIFHARALEYYARCFENIVLIDEDRDLQEFRRKLSSSKGMAADFGQSFGSTGMSGGSSTLGSDTLGTGSSYTYTYGDTSTGTASDARRVRISNTSMMYGDDDDDDDDDDDEDYNVPMRTGMR